MNKRTMSLTIGCLISLFGALFAEETEVVPPNTNTQYGYLSLGVGPLPIPLPQFGVGYRFQRGANGFDVNANVFTIVELTEAQMGLHYFYYMKPNVEKEFYVGFGPAVGAYFQKHRHGNAMIFAPEFVFGKQFLSDTGAIRHFQASLDWPVINNKRDHVRYFPLLYLSYAWGF